MTVEQILKERPSQHGEFEENARATWAIMDALMAERNWNKLGAGKKHALYMIAHKMGRIVAGDPDCLDHWEDIVGYAKLVADRIVKPVKPYDAQAVMKDDLLGARRSAAGSAEGNGSAATSKLSGGVPSRPSIDRPGTPEDGGHHAPKT